MNLHEGLPLWLIKNGLPGSYFPIDESIETEVMILGGGISGALAAYHLTNAGIKCVILDGRTIGLGSTCASTALLQYEIDVPLYKLKDIVGLENAIRAYQICDEAIHDLEKIAEEIKYSEFEKKKSLYFADSRKDRGFIETEFEIRQKNRFDVEFLTADDVKKKYGFNSYGAILSDHAAQMDPYLFTHHVLQHCVKNGLRVYDRTYVKKIKYEKEGVIAETDQKNFVRAKKIIYANGYEAVQYIDRKLIQLYSTYAIASENLLKPNEISKNDLVLWNTADPYFYMRSTADHRIICGGRDERFSNPKKRDALLEKKSKLLEKDFIKLFPKTAFKTEFKWCGTFAGTSDGLPLIGEYEKLPNSYIALGYGGNGITFSQVAGKIIADLISGKENPDAKIFAFDR